MPSTVVYEARFQTNMYNVTDTIIIRITQKPVFGGSVAIFSLNDDRDRLPEGAWIIRTVDNDENPFTPIKAKEAEFKFFSSNAFNLSSFAKGESDEWLVIAYIGSVATPNIFFRGYLVMDVSSEPLAPHPYIITIKATDNIGLLKNKSLVDLDGNTPKGENKIIKYIAWALNQTNMQLPIYVNFNLFEENSPGVPMFDSCYINAKTFESEIGVCEDCYTVLQKILKSCGCRIFELSGAWWIESIYEKRDIASYVHQFDYDGTYVGVASPTFYLGTIDERGAIDFVNDNQNVTIQSPYRKLSFTYKLEYPQEIVDNIDFSQGDAIVVISPTETDYTVDNWNVRRLSQNNETGISSSSVPAFIVRKFDNGYEKERYVVVKFSTESLPYTYLRSNPIPVEQNDKATVSVDYRYSVNTVGDNVGVINCMLKGDNGRHYIFSQSNTWIDTTGFTSGLDQFLCLSEPVYTSSQQKIEWRTASWELDKMPASGDLYIILSAGYNQAGTGDPDVHYSNLRFDYKPYLNGSYAKYTAIKSTVSQDGNLARTLEDTLFISESPLKLSKGALKIFDSSNYVLAGNFYDGQAFPSGVPSSEFLHPFSFQITFMHWQQYRMFKRAIESDMIGLKCSSSALIPDLQKQYFSSIPHPHLINKYFMLLYYEQDFDSQVWKAYFWECYDTVAGLVFTDTYEQKYITG